MLADDPLHCIGVGTSESSLLSLLSGPAVNDADGPIVEQIAAYRDPVVAVTVVCFMMRFERNGQQVIHRPIPV